MSVNDRVIFDPEYWETLAEEKRTQADSLEHQGVFAATLRRHAEDYDRLARMALKYRQQRRTLLGMDPRNKPQANVIPIISKTGEVA